MVVGVVKDNKEQVISSDSKVYNVTINGVVHQFKDDFTIIQACEKAGIEIPRFCYHERLQIAGNCRMCLVEVERNPKLVASCSMNIADGMVIKTNSEKVKHGRESVMETLLINHPLDCPICDQGGECDLQDQAMIYGGNCSNFHEEKRAVQEKNFGKFIKTHMTRCIHCTRCIRFMDEVAGSHELDVINRGENSEIVNLNDGEMKSQLSGNIIDLCPVGALTNAAYAFKARPWELNRAESIDIMDSLCSNIFIDSYGSEIMRILPRRNDVINEEWISNKARFAFDGMRYNRLMSPLLKVIENGELKFKEIDWDEAINILYKKLLSADPNKVLVSSGVLADFDSIILLKKLCENLKINQFDCRSSVPYLPNNFYTLFNSEISGIDETDCIVLVGCDVERDIPVLNARIRKNVNSRNVPVFVIGEKCELNYKYDFVSDDVGILTRILNDDHELSKILNNAKKPMIVLGGNLFSVNIELSKYISNVSSKIIEKFNLMRDDWNGFNILFKNVGLINGLIAGFIDKNKEFFNHSGSHDLCFLLNDDEIDMREVDADFIVYQGHHGGGNAMFADLILPCFAYTEKSATYYNLFGLSQKTNKVVNLPGFAKCDSEIIKLIAKKFNINLDVNVDERIKKANLFISKINDNLENFEYIINGSKIMQNIIVKNSRYFSDFT